VVRWDALPPTLLLTCKEADYAGDIGTIEEFKLVQLDDEKLTYQHTVGGPISYTRMKK